MPGSSGHYEAARWCDNDVPAGKSLHRCSLSRRQQRQRHVDGGSTGNHTERRTSGGVRRLDLPYAVETPRPSRKIADMPHFAKTPSRGQELARKIEQQLDSIGRRYCNAQGVATDQHPAMIIINGPVSKIKRNSAYVTATVIERKKEPARQAGKVGIGTEPGIQPDDQGSDINGATADPGER